MVRFKAMSRRAHALFPPPAAAGPGISFLQGIPAIGTKFDAPSALGPQSQPYVLDNAMFEQTVYMFFGDL